MGQAEFEHYQKIEDIEREKKRKLKSEAATLATGPSFSSALQDAEAVAMFADERKRLREVSEGP